MCPAYRDSRPTYTHTHNHTSVLAHHTARRTPTLATAIAASRPSGERDSHLRSPESRDARLPVPGPGPVMMVSYPRNRRNFSQMFRGGVRNLTEINERNIPSFRTKHRSPPTVGHPRGVRWREAARATHTGAGKSVLERVVRHLGSSNRVGESGDVVGRAANMDARAHEQGKPVAECSSTSMCLEA